MPTFSETRAFRILCGAACAASGFAFAAVYHFAPYW